MGNNSAEDVPKAIAPERPRRRAYVAHLARRRRRGGCRCVLCHTLLRGQSFCTNTCTVLLCSWLPMFLAVFYEFLRRNNLSAVH
jgi:hypothetical protein